MSPWLPSLRVLPAAAMPQKAHSRVPADLEAHGSELQTTRPGSLWLWASVACENQQRNGSLAGDENLQPPFSLNSFGVCVTGEMYFR